MRILSTTASCARAASPISSTPWRWPTFVADLGLDVDSVIAALLHDLH